MVALPVERNIAFHSPGYTTITPKIMLSLTITVKRGRNPNANTNLYPNPKP